MPRSGEGVYSKAVGTTAVPNETITSAQFNNTIDDIVTDLNAARPITAGGTGATSAATARTALGVALAQTTVTDTTASSGLIVGGFGVGGAGVSAAGDLDLAVNGGIYAIAGSTANTPAGTGPSGSSCLVTRWGADDIQQIFLYRGGTADDVRLYIRQRRAGTWGSWLPASGEEGSTANGYYIKHASGWLQAFSAPLTFTRATNTTATATWTLPFACATSPTAHFRIDGLSTAGGDYTGDIAIGDVGHLAYNTAGTPSTSVALTIFRAGSVTWSSGSIANVHVSMSARWY
jgi:hypothetical protein